MPDWGRRLSQLGRLSAVIAGAVWGYRLVRKKRASMSLQELLSLFRSEDIAHCLRERGLPTSGTKQERIDRLIGMAARLDEQAGWSASNVLDESVYDERSKCGSGAMREQRIWESLTAR